MIEAFVRVRPPSCGYTTSVEIALSPSNGARSSNAVSLASSGGTRSREGIAASLASTVRADSRKSTAACFNSATGSYSSTVKGVGSGRAEIVDDSEDCDFGWSAASMLVHPRTDTLRHAPPMSSAAFRIGVITSRGSFPWCSIADRRHRFAGSHRSIRSIDKTDAPQCWMGPQTVEGAVFCEQNRQSENCPGDPCRRPHRGHR